MTTTERNEIERAVKYCNLGMSDTAARSISALYRAASAKAQREILAEAQRLNLHLLPEFII